MIRKGEGDFGAIFVCFFDCESGIYEDFVTFCLTFSLTFSLIFSLNRVGHPWNPLE